MTAQHPLEEELLALQKGLALCQSVDILSVQILGNCLVLNATIQNSAHLSWDLILNSAMEEDHENANGH